MEMQTETKIKDKRQRQREHDHQGALWAQMDFRIPFTLQESCCKALVVFRQSVSVSKYWSIKQGLHVITDYMNMIVLHKSLQPVFIVH